jgi:hypothetical protein
MRITLWRLFVVLCLVALALAAMADSGRGKHKKLYAVPPPGAVTIDGKLDDWDMSAQLYMYIVSETAEQISTKFAMMYDADAIYLGADVRDGSPMMNRNDPVVNADRGWNGDSCQFRMVVDPSQGFPVKESTFQPKPNDQMAHLTLWYYTDRKEPVLQVQQGMTYTVPRPAWAPFGVVPHDLYQAVYLKKADGKGYTFEYRIPWSTLGAKRPPVAGDLVPGTVQLNFSTPDGLTAGGGWLYDVMATPGFTFQNAGCWGKIAFAKTGKLPREMVDDADPPVPPTPLRFSYDVPADGEVSVQLWNDAGMAVRTLVASAPRKAGRDTVAWDGLDDAGKPMPAGTYTWKGLTHAPLKTQFRLSVHNAGTPPYKMDDGTGGWGGDHGDPTCAAAVGDDLLLGWAYCESGWGIIRVDANGKKKWGSKHNAEDLAGDGARFFVRGDNGYEGANSVKVFDMADARPLNWGNGKPFLAAPAGGDKKTDVATGMAYAAGTLYVAWGARDLVGVYDAVSGDLKTTWPVPAPERLAMHPDGRLLAISKGAVVALKDGKATPLITTRLDVPTSLACDAKGAIYVANRGALQQIAVFSAAGKYLRSIGTKGGRPRMGTYSAKGILEPRGITVDAQGRLWVAESIDEPRRFSVWDTKKGTLAREFFGGSNYSTFVWMDPTRPDTLYCHGTEWKVDIDKGTWQPVSTCWRPIDVNSPAVSHELRVITAKNGRQYAWGGLHAKGVVLYIREKDVFKPFLFYLRTTNTHSLTPWPAYPFMGDIKKYPSGTYVWSDTNRDQIMTDAEMQVISEERNKYLFNPPSWMDANLDLWASGVVYRNLGFDDAGRPRYDFLKPETTGVAGNNGHGPLWVDPQNGTLYTNAPGFTPGLAAWTPDGKMRWGYTGTVTWHGAINMPPVTAGKLWGPTMPLGVAGDFTGIATYFGPYHLFTRDGLYVGMIMRDGRLGGGLGADIEACENFVGQLVQPVGSQRFFLLAGDQDGRVTEIFGLDTVKRLPGGTYTHSDADVQRCVQAQADYAAQLTRAARFELGRGGRAGLDAAKEMRKVVDAARQFTVRATYDATHLYVQYNVSSPYELTNAMADPQLLFKGGNLIDLQFATDAAADPKRKTPAPGDVRLLVTRQNGKPYAVLYRPKVAGFTGDPIVLKSPTGQEAFDAITVVNDVKLEYRAGKDEFTAVVSVPLALLGLTPQPGGTVRMDAGYIYAKNAQGSQAAMRAYWTNNSFSANVVDDVPNESRLEPANWGTAAVE